MEIVINVCFGGFSLSDQAETLYAKKKGFEIFRYVQSKYEFRDGVNEYTKIKDGEGGMFSHTFTRDYGPVCNGYDDGTYWSSRDIERNDPALVEVVRELREEANGQCAELKIADIPKDVKWQIEEYDGLEHIAESHATWS